AGGGRGADRLCGAAGRGLFALRAVAADPGGGSGAYLVEVAGQHPCRGRAPRRGVLATGLRLDGGRAGIGGAAAVAGRAPCPVPAAARGKRRVRARPAVEPGAGDMTLHLYFARRFLTVFVALVALFAVMLGLIDMLEQIR